MFESILNSLEKGNIDKIAKDLGGLYKYLTDLVHTIQEYKDPMNELNLDSHNNSNINNNYFEKRIQIQTNLFQKLNIFFIFFFKQLIVEEEKKSLFYPMDF